MNTLYWVIILGTLSKVCFAIVIIAGIALMILTGLLLFADIAPNDYSPGDMYVWNQRTYKNGKRCERILLIVFLISLSGIIFLPSRNQLYTIYNINETSIQNDNSDSMKNIKPFKKNQPNK